MRQENHQSTPSLIHIFRQCNLQDVSFSGENNTPVAKFEVIIQSQVILFSSSELFDLILRDFVNETKALREIILFSRKVMIVSILSSYKFKYSCKSHPDAKKPVLVNVPFYVTSKLRHIVGKCFSVIFQLLEHPEEEYHLLTEKL